MRNLLIAALALLPMHAQIKMEGYFTGPAMDHYAAHSTVVGDTNKCTETAATYANGASAGTYNINKGDGAGTVTKNGKIFCTLNDGGTIAPADTGNVMAYNITTLDMTSIANTVIPATALNQMSSLGVDSGDSNIPVGWAGQCTAGQNTVCNWKSGKPMSVNGWIILPILRQNVAAYYEASDSTLIASPDGGAHWCNPYTFFNHSGSPGCDSSNWQPDGDAPTDPSTAQYTDATHSSMMWKDVTPFNGTSNRMGRPSIFDYCQDNSCTGMPHGADTYLYALGADGRRAKTILARCDSKAIADILDPAKWKYYNHANYSPANVGDGTEWTSTLAAAVDMFRGNGTSNVPVAAFNDGRVESFGEFADPVYLCANGGCVYVFVTNDFQVGPSFNHFVTSFPAPWGPFVRGTRHLGYPQYTNPGFWSLMRFTAYAPDSTPYHTRIATIWDSDVHVTSTTIFLQPMDLNLGAVPSGSNVNGGSNLRFSMSPKRNSLIRRGLVHYFDCFDHMGNIGYVPMNCTDIASYPISAQLLGGFTDGGEKFGYQASTKGVSLDAQGVVLAGGLGYVSRMELRDMNMNAGTAPNLYAALADSTFSANSGDTDFTLSTVMKTTDFSAWQGVINVGPSGNQMYVILNTADWGGYSLSWQAGAGNYFGVGTAGSVMTNNTWVAIDVTYAAGGALNSGNFASRVHIYVNGAEFPAALFAGGTPAVTAGTTTIGHTTAGAGYPMQGSIAGIGWYNRVLASAEIAHNYQVLKDNLAQSPRGITLP